MKLFLFLSFFIFFSCSNFSKKRTVKSRTESYLQTEEGGQFLLDIETGLNQDKDYVLKRKITTSKDDITLERSISIAKFKKLDKNVEGLFPYKSQAEFILNNEKYVSSMTMSAKTLNVSLRSPDAKWNGERTFKVPRSTINFCFFYMILDCAQVTGFLDLASSKGFGSMPVTIVLETYPFFSDQFLNISEEPFQRGELIYDGRNKAGEHRLSFNISNQVIFFFLDEKFNLLRTDWIAQQFKQARR